MILGKGAYGTVTKVDGCAIKKLQKLNHLIREYCAYCITKDCDLIGNCKEINFKTGELCLELYDMDLKKWMQLKCPKNELTNEIKLQIIVKILLALVYLHDRNITHGDLKLGNILVNENPFKLVLSDLGFTSNFKYASIASTAPVYRDKIIINSDLKHDMYSFGICLYEILSEKKIYNEIQNSEMLKYLEHVDDKNIFKPILIKLFGERCNRPSARDILKMLNIPAPPLYNSNIVKVPSQFNEKIRITYKLGSYVCHNNINNIFYNVSKDYNLKRTDKAYPVLINIMIDEKVSPNQYNLWITAMFMIIASVFCSGNRSNHNKFIEYFIEYFTEEHSSIIKRIANSKYFIDLYY